MHLSEQFTVAAPPTVVQNMMSDLRWVQLLAAELRSTVAPSDDATSIRLTVPAPSEISHVVGASFHVDQKLTWDDQPDATSGTFTATVVGLPATFTGRIELQPADNATQVNVAGEFKVRIPLVGSAIEQRAAPKVRQVIAAQQNASRLWLAEH